MRTGVCARPGNVAGAVAGLDYIEGSVGDLLCPREDESAFEPRLSAVRAAPAPVEAVNGFFPADLWEQRERISARTFGR